MKTFSNSPWITWCMAVLWLAQPSCAAADEAGPRKAEMARYLLVPHGRVAVRLQSALLPSGCKVVAETELRHLRSIPESAAGGDSAMSRNRTVSGLYLALAFANSRTA